MAEPITIYVAAPTDQAGEHARTIVGDVIEWLHKAPHIIAYRPTQAFTVGPDTAVHPSIESINRAALEQCDALLAVLPAGTPTVGVPREVEFATSIGIPVAVLTDIAGSFSLADTPTFPLSGDGIEDAVELLTKERRVTSPGLCWLVGPNGQLPTRAHPTDAGYDLYVSHDINVAAGQFVDVQTDVRVALPPHTWGRIVGRSSTLRRRGLLVVEAVIDPGYRGPIYTGVQNLSDFMVVVRAGERLAQFIPHINVASGLASVQVDEARFEAIPHDGRGASGFGSSGH